MKAKLTLILAIFLMLVGCRQLDGPFCGPNPPVTPAPIVIPEDLLYYCESKQDWIPLNGEVINFPKESKTFTITLKSIGVFVAFEKKGKSDGIDAKVLPPLELDKEGHFINKPCEYFMRLDEPTPYYIQNIEVDTEKASSISVKVRLINFADHTFKLVRK